ncbi:hypothetical protein HDU67_008969 [Dinochytrium kinnereticum]|nr:hypothetical protein HDU67_008969 [Dinochytrium kinnereticum]
MDLRSRLTTSHHPNDIKPTITGSLPPSELIKQHSSLKFSHESSNRRPSSSSKEVEELKAQLSALKSRHAHEVDDLKAKLLAEKTQSLEKIKDLKDRLDSMTDAISAEVKRCLTKVKSRDLDEMLEGCKELSRLILCFSKDHILLAEISRLMCHNEDTALACVLKAMRDVSFDHIKDGGKALSEDATIIHLNTLQGLCLLDPKSKIIFSKNDNTHHLTLGFFNTLVLAALSKSSERRYHTLNP